MKKMMMLAVLVLLACSGVMQAVEMEWVRQSDSPVLDTGGPSPYESYHVQQPSVIIEDGMYKMWYTGYRGGPSPRMGICYATSTDKGLTWTKHGTVLEVTEEWERYSPPNTYNYINHPTVVYEEGMYKMWYTATGGSLGYTTSVDGINWGVKTQQLGLGNPYDDIVKGPSNYKLYYSKSDAIYVMESSDGGVSDPWEVANEDNPILILGDPGDWDSSGIGSPNVRYEPETGEFQMWYYGDSTSGAPSIGFALSYDGLLWEKDITNPVLEPVPGTWESGWVIPGSVVFDSSDSMYRMFYGGYHFDHWAIGLAAVVSEPVCKWVLLDGELNIPRHALTGEALNGYVYAIGGVVMPGSPSDAQNAVSKYDPVADSWTLESSMPTARHSLSSAVINGWIYAVGGHVSNSRSENERYNGTSWESRASVYARSGPGVATYNGKGRYPL